MTDRITVLDHGYVELVDHMGDDKRVVDAARTSYNQRSSEELSSRDVQLIDFLARNGHTSPFRHNMLTFEVRAPLLVVRQLQRYVIGGNHSDTLGAWSEMSFRYVRKGFKFYTPTADQWRTQSKNSKQGSAGLVDGAVGTEATYRLIDVIDKAMENYEWAMQNGIAGEQARLFLPAFGLYSTWWMTLSLQAVCHLWKERIRPDAMLETREYAKAMLRITRNLFPESIRALFVSNGIGNPTDMEDEYVNLA